MPRDANGYFNRLLNYVAGTKVRASDVNLNEADIVADLNTPRPIVVGGTGATTAAEARQKLGITDLLASYLRSDARSATTKGLTVASDTTDALFVKSPGNTFIGFYRDTAARKGYIQSQNAGDGNTNLAISNEIRNLTIAANGQMYWDGNAFSIGGGPAASPYLHMSYPNVRAWYWQVDSDAHMRLVDNSAGAQTHKFQTNGDIISKYCSDNRPGGDGSLMSWIEYRAAAFADSRIGQLRNRIQTVGEVDSFVIARLSGGPRPSVGGAYAGSQLLDADNSAGLGLGGTWRCLSQASTTAPYAGLFYRYA